MDKTQIKTAPRKTDAVNVVWRSHAANVMRKECPGLTDKEVSLGRLKLKNFEQNRLNGYVVFYAFVCRNRLSRTRKMLLLWKEKCSGEKFGDYFIVLIKAFKNEKNKPRRAFILPQSALESEMEYRPNNTFRAVDNTEWRYAVRGDDCEIITETYYRCEKY